MNALGLLVMPLYLMPLSKTENATTVMPWQSMGGKAFTPDDPESMEFLKAVYARAQQEIRPVNRSILTTVFGWFGVRYLAEDPSVTKFRDHWSRPFEEVVADVCASPNELLVREYDPQILESTEYLSRLEDFPNFPLYALYDHDGPDGESTTNFVVVDDVDAEEAFLDFEGRGPKQPDGMRRAADIFDRAATNYKPEEDEEYDEAGVTALRAAAEWLRFWADRGHPCEAQRFLRSGQGWYRIEVG